SRHRSLIPPHNHTAPTARAPLSLHDALPISANSQATFTQWWIEPSCTSDSYAAPARAYTSPSPDASTTTSASTACRPSLLSITRSEEHTSELQSLTNIACRLLLDTKNTHHSS